MAFKGLKGGGRAGKMGVLAGDVLAKVDGEEVASLRQIFQFAREATGDTVTFTFLRGSKAFEAKARKDERPERPARPTRAPGDTVPAPGGVVR